MGKARWIPLGMATMVAAVVVAVAGAHGAPPASTSATVGTSFPAGFPTIVDSSLGTPVLGFGAAGAREADAGDLPARQQRHAVSRRSATPLGQDPRARAGLRRPRLLAERGLGARLPGRPVRPRGVADEPVRDRAHDGRERRRPGALRRRRCASTPARSASTSSATASAGRSRASGCAATTPTTQVRRLVTIASPHHGIIDCSPSPLNYFALPALGGFNPDSAICVELGAADTPFLERLNRKETNAGRRSTWRFGMQTPTSSTSRLRTGRSSRPCRRRTGTATRTTSRRAPRSRGSGRRTWR